MEGMADFQWKLIVRFMYVVVYMLMYREADPKIPIGGVRDDLRRELKRLD